MSKRTAKEEQALQGMLAGPWVVSDDPDSDYEIVLVEDGPPFGSCIIATCNQEYLEIAELLAAAPALLAACEYALDTLIDWDRDDGESGSILRAAIAKAKGEL